MHYWWSTLPSLRWPMPERTWGVSIAYASSCIAHHASDPTPRLSSRSRPEFVKLFRTQPAACVPAHSSRLLPHSSHPPLRSCLLPPAHFPRADAHRPAGPPPHLERRLHSHDEPLGAVPRQPRPAHPQLPDASPLRERPPIRALGTSLPVGLRCVCATPRAASPLASGKALRDTARAQTHRTPTVSH